MPLTQDTNGEVHFHYDRGSLRRIIVGGRDVLRAGYLIGSGGGPDDPQQNVESLGVETGVLRAPGSFPGSPFTYRVSRLDSRSVRLDVSVGPLAAPHMFLSSPMDMDKASVQTFRFAANGYVVGCGNSWSSRAGSTGRYADIPTPCVIPIPEPNRVGVARPDRLDPWMEVEAPGIATIRRTLLTPGALREGTYTNHPHTHCLDWSWVRGWPGNARLAQGSVLTYSEQITVTPWGAGPAPPPTSAPVFTTAPRVTVTGDTLRLEWQTDVPTAASLRGWDLADPGGALVLPSVTSPWTFVGLRPATRYQIDVTCRDAAGRSVLGSVTFTTSPLTPPPPVEIEMKVTIHVPAFTRDFEVSDQAQVLEGSIPIRVTVTPSSSPAPIPTPPPIPGTLAPALPHATDFLSSGFRTHTYAGHPPVERERVRKAMTDRGYRHIYVYAYNERDYGGPAFDFLRNPQGFRAMLEELRGVGLAPVVWLFPDDAPTLHAHTTPTLQGLISGFVPVVDDLVSSYVIGLELDEYWNANTVDALGKTLRALTTKKIGVHMTTGKWDYARNAWCDYMVLQYGFGKSADAVASMTRSAIASLGKPVVAGEYELDNESRGRPLGDAAVAAGATGFGNGGTVPAPAPTGDPYVRWPNVGVTTPEQVTGIYLEQFGRIPTAAQMQHELSLQRTPAMLWYLLQDNSEWAARHPGQAKHPPPGGASPPPPPPSGTGDAFDIQSVLWVRDNESDAKGFAPRARLTDVSITAPANGAIHYQISGHDHWPAGTVDQASGNMISFVRIAGQWYGAAWEWLGNHTRQRNFAQNLATHLSNETGMNPREQLVRANPVQSGDEVGVMVCSVVRGSQRTVNERTQIVVVRVP